MTVSSFQVDLKSKVKTRVGNDKYYEEIKKRSKQQFEKGRIIFQT